MSVCASCQPHEIGRGAHCVPGIVCHGNAIPDRLTMGITPPTVLGFHKGGAVFA